MKFKSYILVALTALAACTSHNAEERRILSVSIEPQRQILEQLVGDHFDVVTVLGKGVNPETYEPSMAQRISTDRSEAYFITGYLPFETSLAESLNDKTAIVNTSYGIKPVTGTHTHGDGEEHSWPDPHVWTSLRNAQVMADNMTDALVKIDPDNKDYYISRNHTLKQQLDSADRATAQRLSDAGVHAFVVWHPSLSYYARDYGLHQIAVGQESKEQSISSLRDIIDEARADSVKIFFFQREYDSRQVESLNREIGSELVVINPLDYDWQQQLELITDALTK